MVAGFAGYVLGSWNGTFPHATALSATQSVALRFPQDTDDAAVSTIAPAATLGNAQVALLSPQPMVQPAPQASAPTVAPAPQAATAPTPTAQPAKMQVASVDNTAVVAPPPAARPAPVKIATAAVRRLAERPGFVLNDAQIASIKERLHLSADQEEMWPAVEAALRNLAYTRAREARRHSTPANTQIASADPNSTDVQDLKSAAIPLIMSFNSEQKDEVRNIAHVMGLDQLANQF
jgi:pyruvate/2-oxoglutarate dehydrogenase complex dihydrolipoamide acyltransferase (E2) component